MLVANQRGSSVGNTSPLSIQSNFSNDSCSQGDISIKNAVQTGLKKKKIKMHVYIGFSHKSVSFLVAFPLVHVSGVTSAVYISN